jgi:hypothetical protein
MIRVRATLCAAYFAQLLASRSKQGGAVAPWQRTAQNRIHSQGGTQFALTDRRPKHARETLPAPATSNSAGTRDDLKSNPQLDQDFS